MADIYDFELIQNFFPSLEGLTFPVGTLWLRDLEDINGSSSMGCSENNVRIDAQLISYPDKSQRMAVHFFKPSNTFASV